jgi:hypothetical protein
MAIGSIKTYPVLNIGRVSPKDQRKDHEQQNEDDEKENNGQEESNKPDVADGHIDEFA